MDLKSPIKRVIAKGDYSVKNVKVWVETYNGARCGFDYSQMSRQALVDAIFGRLMSQMPGSCELQRMSVELGGPVKFTSTDGVWLNFGSPFDRRAIPFWHWVA